MSYADNHHSISRRSVMRGGAIVGAGAALSGLPIGATEAHAHAAARWPHLTAMMKNYVDSGRVASMLSIQGLGDGRPEVVAAGYDTMGGGRLSDADSLYRLYSLTKLITGMATMMLIDEGKLGLDQPLAEILPKFAEMQVQKEYDGSIGPENLEPAVRPITIRQMLTHTSGLSYSIVQQGPISQKSMEMGVVSGQVSRIPVPEFLRGTSVRSLELFADRLADLPLIYQPGTRWNYSTGLDLMGRVIEVVSGQSFDSFLQERILDPCGMTSTWFRVPASEVSRLTTNYGIIDGRVVPVDPAESSIYLDEPAFPMGGSGLVGSPRDYDRFLKMIGGYGRLEGHRVMGELAVRVATSNLFPSTMDPSDPFMAQWQFGAAGRIGWTAGTKTFGWTGAAATVGFVDMDSGLRSGLFTQYMPSGAYPVYTEFPDAVDQDLAFQKGEL